MSAVRGKNTKPEVAVRRYLFARGLRFRIHVKRLPGCPDIVLRRYNAAIFVNGCFWHGHQGCRASRLPETNADFWRQKINMNIARDYRTTVELRLLGWRVFTVWECELKPKVREATLERLYAYITGCTTANLSLNERETTQPMAAEPQSAYGEEHVAE